MDDSAAPPASDAERELAARRRDLEHEFQDKVRDLKAQVKRQQESLQQDRLDWESSKRTQAKEIADRAEKLRRQEDNHKRDLEALRVARRELEAAQGLREEHLATRMQAKEQAKHGSELEVRLRATRGLLAAATFLAIAASAAFLALVVLGERRVTPWVAAAALVAALALEWRRRRLARHAS